MNKEEKINWVADKILEGIGREKDLINIASRQKKLMSNFKEIYELARQQIIKELKSDKEKLKTEFEFYKEMED